MNGVEYLIGLRYVRAKKRNHFISFITLISMLGIALGVTVIIAVLSVMNGFKQEIQTKILDFTSHGFVSSFDRKLKNWEKLTPILEENENVTAFAPYLEAQMMLVNGNEVSGAYIHGILPELETGVSRVEDRMLEGSLQQLQPAAWGIVLGETLARALEVDVGDKVTLLSSHLRHTPAGAIPKMRRFTVTGIFRIGMSQYDRHIAFLNVKDAQKITRSDEMVSGIHIRYSDMFRAPEFSAELQQRLGPDYWVSDWTKRHRNFFRALEMEKLILLIIMALIIAVAAFNIVSTLIMLVFEKQGDIAVLKTRGMTSSRILRIFIIQGCVIGISGAVLGVAGGIALASYLEELVAGIERLLGVKFLSPDVYPITQVPSQLLLGDVVTTALLVFVLTVLATLYPAWRAAKVRPTEALRYE